MLRTLTLLMLTVQASCAGTTRVGSFPAADLMAKLNKHVSNYNLGVFSFVGALIRVSGDFEVPMGITWVNSPTTRAELPFAWKDATVLEVIQAIVKTRPGYAVEIKNGVVHIFPAGMIPDRENFLKLKIPAFETHDTIVELASFKLHMLVTPIKGTHQINVAGPGDSKVSLELRDCEVEDVLDALAVASNRKIWIVTFADEPTLTTSGLRATRSLFTDDPIRDVEQPVWYLHRWSDPMPPGVGRN